MIYVDGSEVKVGGVVLPGLFKSLEVTNDAQIDEQTVEGSTSKPKQATGYEDAKVTIELVLDDSPKETKMQKLSRIQNLFRAPGQGKPTVHDIVNSHTAIRGITRVLFKSLGSKETNSSGQMTVSIEFWEYVPQKITATKTSSKSQSKSSKSSKSSKKKKSTKTSNTAAVGITSAYQSYLKHDRGKAPTATSKTTSSPARDTASTTVARNRLKSMPY